ncbi:MAG: 2-oxoglutarate dehydrogenase complex dihydrolipoyllysine-residue succinyltransferase [Alphaproteobacteria bacterium]|nr:2-oxoglutarate dehydrogenase complex dihydrolipoyllysine-residue succinyltransferase [Alphaproteobacteria bacterium]
MTADIIVPDLGESVTEATVSKWFKKEGDSVQQDEQLVELETDKVTLEVNAPSSGALISIKAKEGDTLDVGALLGIIDPKASGNASSNDNKTEAEAAPQKPESKEPPAIAPKAAQSDTPLSPAVRKMVAENNVNPANVQGTGKDGRLTKGDVITHLEGGAMPAAVAPAQQSNEPREERVKMTKLRQVIARRLKESQNTAAILTTFNEIDMTNVMALRSEYKEAFEKKHGVRLGFMGFFVKAAVNALKEIPEVNAEIDGDEIVYKNHYDIGVAVGTEKGLVVPVIRDSDVKSLAEIESSIGDMAKKARNGTLTQKDMSGGTFTVSNGGVYGSLMSTPIINPPQSGILGMHKTEMRPVVMKDGSIVARPMMYVALSYDHRIIDGRESVTFLVRVKEALEDPRRLLLGL